MKRTIALASLVLLLSATVFAGGKGEKCKQPVQTCLNEMVLKLKQTGFIGVELDQGKNKEVLIVSKVIEGSPAEKAGIRVGDELYALNGIRYNKENDDAINKVKVPGNTVACTIRRNGNNREFQLTLVPMPADLMAKYIGEHMMEHASPKVSVAKK